VGRFLEFESTDANKLDTEQEREQEQEQQKEVQVCSGTQRGIDEPYS
jgi:hypothetical protein